MEKFIIHISGALSSGKTILGNKLKKPLILCVYIIIYILK